jgi:signal transduction histidine kinase
MLRLLKKISLKYRYLLFGILFGCVFPLFAVFFDCFIIRKDSFSFDKIGIIFSENPLHYIIATAPLFLGMAFFIAGRMAETRQLMNANLKRTNQQLLQLNESYNTFNYHVSHDLKTIVTNGQSLALMIHKYASKNNMQKVIELTEMLRQTCETGNETIKGFLQLHRVTGHVAEDELSDTPVLPIIQEITDQLQNQAPLIVTITAQEFETLPMPAARVRSLFQNLLSNSVKYSNGTPEVKLSFVQQHNTLLIYYSDNGKGIDMKKHGSKLFQPFTRIEENKSAGSTGIGLYLIKQMLDQYGAVIKLDSELGKGVQIEISFPV